MHITLLQRMRTVRRTRSPAHPWTASPRRRMDDPLAFARGLMNAFVLSLLIWILVALGLAWAP